MRVEAIRLKNFRAFRDVQMRDIPGFCVLIGANGTGKSTLFSVFSFLRDAMTTNVTAALGRLGGSRGFQEVRSRNSEGPILHPGLPEARRSPPSGSAAGSPA